MAASEAELSICLLVIPIVVLTLLKVLHFAYERRNWIEQVPFIVILLNTLIVWIGNGIFYAYEKTSSIESSVSYWFVY